MNSKMTGVTVIGTTAWGTTLGIILGRKGIEVKLWARTEEEAKKLIREQENTARLPGISFPKGLRVTSSLKETPGGTELVILAVPSQSMQLNVRLIKEHLRGATFILSATKGLEAETGRRMSQVIAEEPGSCFQPNILALSGPNLSGEIARGLPATTVIAATDASIAERVQEIIASPTFRVYTNNDVVGVELGGALKNIIALAAGMVDGLGYGNNFKSTLITRGLAEITRLGMAMGANPSTFFGLAGLGDLVATCSSPLSRNRFVGEQLAEGHSLAEILASMKGTAEGINTAIAAHKLAQKFNVEMPITEEVHQVLFEGQKVPQAISELMEQELKEQKPNR